MSNRVAGPRGRGWTSVRPAARRRRPMAYALALALLSAGAAAGAAGLLDFGQQNQEPVIPDPIPKVPDPPDTQEFYVTKLATNRFAIDPASVAIDAERVIRFTLLVTSSSEVRNVSYEAIRCSTGEHRLLALARADGSWVQVKTGGWRKITNDDSVNRPRLVLMWRWCEGDAAASLKPTELVRRLKDGNPLAP